MPTATIDRPMQQPAPRAQEHATSPARVRDARLDFFRGLSLFIIFVNHIPGNPWNMIMPAKWGLSDATEVFVFCSGMASALAFARVFETHGIGIGVARIAYRCWEVYWAHIGCFMAVIALMIASDRLLGTGDQFLHSIGLTGFLEQERGARLLGLMTLTYVPPYFDILPMYLVILTLILPVMLLSRIHPWLAMAASVALWAAASQQILELPRDPLVAEPWFFNPFSWQLVFFAGFAVTRGWVHAPGSHPALIIAAVLIVLASVPLSWKPAYDTVPLIQDWRTTLASAIDKTHEGPLRFLHFLSIAYLATCLAGPSGSRLDGRVARLVRSVGRQSLGCFMTGLALSFLGGVALAMLGRDNIAVVAAVNLTGIGLIVLAAFLAAWFKSYPWHRRSAGREE